MLTKNNIESNKNKLAKEDLKDIAETKVAEKDKQDLIRDFEGDINQGIINLYNKKRRPGESIDEFMKRIPVEELIKIALRDGGPANLSGYSIADMKAIFRSENGYDAKTPKELVRGVKMYLKNLDLDGIPFGTFGKGDK